VKVFFILVTDFNLGCVFCWKKQR